MEGVIDNIKTTQEKLMGPHMSSNELELYHDERRTKTLGNIRLATIMVVLMVTLFGIIDYYTINSSSTILKLTIVRVLFVLGFILPLYLLSFRSIYKKHFDAFLFITIFLYLLFLHAIAWLSVDSHLALFHIYLGVVLVIITMHLLLGLSAYSSILLSALSIIMSNFVMLSLHIGYTIAIPIIHLNLWFIIATLLAFTFSIYFDSLAKTAFLMQLKLKEENALKNKLFGVVAHDLKNMIASQYSIAEFLSDNHLQISEKKRGDMLKILNQSASNVMEVFEDLMQWIKAQLETTVIHNKAISVKKLINTITELMLTSAHSKQINITNDNIPDYKIITDANLLGLVIRNLLGNAIKFSETGSTVEIRVENQTEVTEIQIIDQGIGMNQNLIDRVFNLDNVESSPGTEGESGTGLGLILSKELMTLLKGELIIESYPTKGTTITLLIPNL